MRGQMTPFDGRRDNDGWTDAPLGSGWAGNVDVARDRRTVCVNLDVTKASWVAGETVATLTDEFRPTSARPLAALLADGTPTSLVVTLGGLVQAGVSGVGGLTCTVTFIQ